MLNPLLLGLAAMATLLALAVAGILAALYRKHSTGRPGSPKHAPIVCEPPNAGATTPVHPQTKQAVDDIDPDIIPNEYGEFVGVPIYRERVSRVKLHPRARACPLPLLSASATMRPSGRVFVVLFDVYVDWDIFLSRWKNYVILKYNLALFSSFSVDVIIIRT